MIYCPLVPVFLYGMFMESVPLFNSRRKSYLILFSVLQAFTLVYLFVEPGEIGVSGLVVLMCINSFCLGV